MSASNESTEVPVDHTEYASLQPGAVLLRVPNLTPTAHAEWASDASPTAAPADRVAQTQAPEEGSGQNAERPQAERPQAERPKTSVSLLASTRATLPKTMVGLKKFAATIGYFGTLGTIAAAIFACTLVARAMKQDRLPEGAAVDLALTTSPPPTASTNDSLVAEVEVAEAVAPDFDPELLQAGTSYGAPAVASSPPPPGFAEGGAQPGGSFDRRSAVASRREPWSAAAGAHTAASPSPGRPHAEDAVAANSGQPSGQDSFRSPFWTQPTQPVTAASSEAAVPAQPTADTFSAPLNRDFSPADQGNSVPSPPLGNHVAPWGDVSRPAGEVNRVPYQNRPQPSDVWPASREHRQTPTVRDRQTDYQNPTRTTTVGAQRADRNSDISGGASSPATYPSTSQTAYPSLQEWGASLYAKSERERQIRLGDSRDHRLQQTMDANRDPSLGIVR